ncbi:MAG: carbamoyl-phosphate synthase large subunit [Bdellovibrionaceae bacterium]|nr:carbamoyl-phosphate synthase large subunit [Pseudobdellovibrionaceae bacterium]
MSSANAIPYKKILIIGSGPIVIGQACEFDYSGTQACKALTSLGVEVVLVNSNPATIMTDPDVASKVYIEPLKKKFLLKILEKEKPDAVIPTLGGQTALNLALELYEDGIFDRLNIKMLGANPDVIQAAEDREKFNDILVQVGASKAQSVMVSTFEQGLKDIEDFNFPVILRPNYTLGGAGGGVAYSLEEYKTKLANALHESPTSEVLVEQSLLGWYEYELEIMRDKNGTFVVICSIENIDPCGVHTGDSITVAPQQTLSDKEYQEMRDEAQKIVNAVGVETGGANIQFAVHPTTRERVVIEMNPRVSRSSALASKATGFPIAKIAALLAVGQTLEEIQNDITKTTPSCYEPALDYVVTKIPRFAFEKFTGSEDHLTTQMKSVGEVMGIGRTFKESFSKAYVSLEHGHMAEVEVEFVKEKVSYPNSERMDYLFEAFRRGHSVSELNEWTGIHPWFLEQLKEIVDFEEVIRGQKLTEDSLKRAKRLGFTDKSISKLVQIPVQDVKGLRKNWGITPSYLQVDTCAGEFASETPYFYSTYWSEKPQGLDVFLKSQKERIVIIGSGPNRIGQGIEFDYGCVRSVKALRALGYEVAMINSNPETVSTDYDTSDFLFFEPLDPESVIEVCEALNPKGFVCQLGGQTPIRLAPSLEQAGFQILGSSLHAIDLAEDRGQFVKIVEACNANIPKSGMAADVDEALKIVAKIGYPVMLRPSYVLGGRRMEIVESEVELQDYFSKYKKDIDVEHPCLIDQFLERALEIDVDLVRAKDWKVIGGVIEHIEAAGVHSGDSMGVMPPQRLKPETLKKIEELSLALADRLQVIGFLNLQLAVKDDEVYVLEANPRSSRTVPFVSKATRIPLVDIGMRAILGLPLTKTFNWQESLDKVVVKGVSFPFKKFPNADSILGPEMKSTGESMGVGTDYSEALLKAMISVGLTFPDSGEVFLSLRDKDKQELLPDIKKLVDMGYTLSATGGTADFIQSHGIECLKVKKVHEGRPHCVDRIRSGEVCLVINTTSGKQSIDASFSIRRSCIDYSIPCLTESDAAQAFLLALQNQKRGSFDVYPLQKGLQL